LTEWLDPEVPTAQRRRADGTLHPMDLKKIPAGEVTAAIHGVDVAMKSREEFVAQFEQRRYRELGDLPTVTDLSQAVTQVVKDLGSPRATTTFGAWPNKRRCAW
jgi:tyrosyl-tRNA synthetase